MSCSGKYEKELVQVTHDNTIMSCIQLHKVLIFVLMAVCTAVSELDSRAVYQGKLIASQYKI